MFLYLFSVDRSYGNVEYWSFSSLLYPDGAFYSFITIHSLIKMRAQYSVHEYYNFIASWWIILFTKVLLSLPSFLLADICLMLALSILRTIIWASFSASVYFINSTHSLPSNLGVSLVVNFVPCRQQRVRFCFLIH